MLLWHAFFLWLDPSEKNLDGKSFFSSNILSPFTYVFCVSFSLHLVLLILTFFIVFIVLFTRLPFYNLNSVTLFFFFLLAIQFNQFFNLQFFFSFIFSHSISFPWFFNSSAGFKCPFSSCPSFLFFFLSVFIFRSLTWVRGEGGGFFFFLIIVCSVRYFLIERYNLFFFYLLFILTSSHVTRSALFNITRFC